ncbi:transporter substrate-binding domain-containing protein [Pseudalkalibacillus caeni]|uniref:Transporter substrate-binding domain-containing protein n=2 Tax=Exobacillus caeni TaxID=2574798 RepID=A0A5R9F3S1_9BACL|nr:transporter substrate-binding domain-containing protein [Pseudalkalibacillus caeni]
MIAALTALLISALSACGSGNDDTAENNGGNGDTKEVLTIGTEATYPPFSFRGDDNEITGYDVEVAREVADRIGMEAEFKPTEWKAMLESLRTDRFDMVANQVTITEERKETFDFSIPYTVSGGQVIVHENNKEINGLDDLKGKVVGTTQGSNYADIAKEAGAEVKFYKGAQQVLSDLNDKRIDAALNDRLFILEELPKTGFDLKSVGDVFNKNEMAFAFNKSNDDLVKKVNDALKEMKKDGTLADISKKYFGEDVSE